MAKVLVVDDSLLARRQLRAILEGMGHEVIEATDGISAVEKFFLESPDLVTLDLTMEGMSGVEVLERLLQIDPSAKVVMATADIQTFTKDMVKKAGAKGILNKPFSRERVEKCVGEALKGGEAWN